MCKIPNLPLEEIDPKCREFVYLLNKYGFKTIYCCQGHKNGSQYYIMFDESVTDEKICELIFKLWRGYSPSYDFNKWVRIVEDYGKPRMLKNWVYSINSKLEVNGKDVSMRSNHNVAKNTCKRLKECYGRKTK